MIIKSKGNWTPPSDIILPGIYLSIGGGYKNTIIADPFDENDNGYKWLVDANKLRLKTSDGLYLTVKL